MFSNNPQYVSSLQAAGRSNEREPFLSFINTHNHTVVLVADAAVLECFADEGTCLGDSKATEFHLMLFYLCIFWLQF